MELDLSLGDPSKQALGYLSKNREISSSKTNGAVAAGNPTALGLCMAMGKNSNIGRQDSSSLQFVRDHDYDNDDEKSEETTKEVAKDFSNDQRVSPGSHPPVQLDLLPFASILSHTPSHSEGLPWSSGNSEGGGSSGNGPGRGFDVNRLPTTTATAEEVSSPNSAASSIKMDFSLFRVGGNASGSGNGGKRRNSEGTVILNEAIEAERASSIASEEDDSNLNPCKKLRLSKEQSAFLEESFKEHGTLNPKRKLALAKQLSLSPRQVEVWFQNRRARTKLKQTELDCEYLKRCCGTLTEENRRLHKELQELRALKASNLNPFYMQPPATTLTMCPSCERTTATSTKPSTVSNNSNSYTTRTDISTTPNDKTSIRFPTVITRSSFFPPSNKPTILKPRKGVLNLKL